MEMEKDHLQPDRALCTPAVGTARQVRGGSWNNHRHNLRCANRNRNTPDNRNNNVGFRCANTGWRPAKIPQSLLGAAAVSAGALPDAWRCGLPRQWGGRPASESSARAVPGWF
ncbi:MAG: SUMF1/EgtB/PvdO family nonheme iron enzyme [Anaerolineae bacterium]|nr:SUMF1/EgtB/PvdO family nonheme iron enzyme [Anaerolineae bacterium]